ncbi:MAG: type II toxin-antitoxin system VapC family toxin [Myxococcota bacterium]|jgi:PIN domain nuclease of toxin-antitoxin system
MKVLLDTHAFLWFITGDERLSKKARRLMEDGETGLLLSAASVWEMAIKTSLGKLSVPLPFDEFIRQKTLEGFVILPVEWHHAARVAGMPFHHRDPFDRLLAAQALTERLSLVTADKAFKKYGVKTVW